PGHCKEADEVGRRAASGRRAKAVRCTGLARRAERAFDRVPERGGGAERAARGIGAQLLDHAFAAADRGDTERAVSARERLDHEALAPARTPRAERARVDRIATVRRERREQRVDTGAVARRDERDGRLPALRLALGHAHARLELARGALRRSTRV